MIADTYEFRHGTSYLQPLYGPDFEHFDWANRNAPKGGMIRAAEMGTFDSFNGILDKGRVAAGVTRGGLHALIYDSLLEQAQDEPAAYYSRLAEGICSGRLPPLRHSPAQRRPLARRQAVDRRRRHLHVRNIAGQGAAGVRTALRELGTSSRSARAKYSSRRKAR